jgi:serine/threonine protein kinase
MKNILPEEAKHYQVGTVISGRYRVVEVLGWGAVGYVLKVADMFLNEQICALKILLKRSQQDQTTMARFRREVIIARTLGHAHIVRVFDIGVTEEGDPFVSMECIEGMTLHKMIAMGSIDTSQRFAFLRDIADGLAYAHRKGIIHRDLKPSNIMVDSAGKAKITDFGTAIGAFSQERLTRPDELIGSPLYISPEAIKTGTIDGRSDIYAFGVLAFTIFEEEPPFFHPNWAALAHLHVSAPIPTIKSTHCPQWCIEMITRCMAKDPDDRYQSFSEILELFARYSEANTERKQAVNARDLVMVAGGALVGSVLGAILL